MEVTELYYVKKDTRRLAGITPGLNYDSQKKSPQAGTQPVWGKLFDAEMMLYQTEPGRTDRTRYHIQGVIRASPAVRETQAR